MSTQLKVPDKALKRADRPAAPLLKGRSFHFVLFLALILAVTALALALRLPRLAERPMHTDEAVHAVKLADLLDTGRYIYNPHEYHGPTLYYFTLPLLWLSGIHNSGEIAGEVQMRLVPALFGAGLILLLLLLAEGLGRPAAFAAALLTALSPAMVFYSRYYIQEMLLVFFTFAAIAAAWRYTRHRRVGWAILAGASLGLMQATKETSVIAYASMAGAVLLTMLWSSRVDARRLRLRAYFHHWHVILALHVTVAVAILCLTLFLTNPGAAVDILRSLTVYLGRGSTGDSSTNGAAVHNHPWDYYLTTLAFTHNGAGPWWSEGLILALALVGLFVALRPREPRAPGNINLVRFIAFYTVLMTTVYSAIPYKTPWCLLGFLHGFILLAGVGAAALWRWLRPWPLRVALAAALLAGSWNLGQQAWRGATLFAADSRNPYVYAHTAPNALRLVQRARDLGRVSPAGDKMIIKMVVPGDDYWPLPWYFRNFKYVGCYNHVPDDPEAPLIITTPDLKEPILEKLRANRGEEDTIVEHYGLRPGVVLVALIRGDLWAKFIAEREKAQ